MAFSSLDKHPYRYLSETSEYGFFRAPKHAGMDFLAHMLDPSVISFQRPSYILLYEGVFHVSCHMRRLLEDSTSNR